MPSTGSTDLQRIDDLLSRICDLADTLKADPDGHVRRSVAELQAAFMERRAVEPAITRMQESVRMLRRDNRDGGRREFQRRAPGLDHLEGVISHELLPALRRMSFEV